MLKKVSILIVNYNRINYLRGTLESIFKNTEWPYEILIWDNASTEKGMKEYLEELDKKENIKVYFSDKNIGVWKASNQLISHAQNLDTLGFIKCDNDCIIKTKGWIKKWIECCNVNKEVGMIGANIEGKKERSKDTEVLCLKGHRLLSLIEEGTGGLVYVPGRVFKKLGFYNETHGLYGHADKDYARRVMTLGLKFCYHRDVEVNRFAVNSDDMTGGYREHKNLYVRRNRKLYILNRYMYKRRLKSLSIWYKKFRNMIPKEVFKNASFCWSEDKVLVNKNGKVSQFVRDQIDKYKLNKVKK